MILVDPPKLNTMMDSLSVSEAEERILSLIWGVGSSAFWIARITPYPAAVPAAVIPTPAAALPAAAATAAGMAAKGTGIVVQLMAVVPLLHWWKVEGPTIYIE